VRSDPQAHTDAAVAAAGRPRRRPGGLADWAAARLRDLRAEGERGAAVIEFAVIFVTLLVPLVYVIVIGANIQQTVLATSSAAREVGRVYATSPTRAVAEARGRQAYQDMLANYGLDGSGARARIQISTFCPSGSPPTCTGGFGPGAEIRVEVVYDVPLLRLPFLGADVGGYPVGATNHTRANRFGGLG
jgi:hypothetical protein